MKLLILLFLLLVSCNKSNDEISYSLPQTQYVTTTNLETTVNSIVSLKVDSIYSSLDSIVKELKKEIEQTNKQLAINKSILKKEIRSIKPTANLSLNEYKHLEYNKDIKINIDYIGQVDIKAKSKYEFDITILKGSRVSSIVIEGNTSNTNDYGDLIINIDNKANNRTPSYQISIINKLTNTIANLHSLGISPTIKEGMITTYTFPNLRGFGDKGYQIQLKQ